MRSVEKINKKSCKIIGQAIKILLESVSEFPSFFNILTIDELSDFLCISTDHFPCDVSRQFLVLIGQTVEIQRFSQQIATQHQLTKEGLPCLKA